MSTTYILIMGWFKTIKVKPNTITTHNVDFNWMDYFQNVWLWIKLIKFKIKTKMVWVRGLIYIIIVIVKTMSNDP